DFYRSEHQKRKDEICPFSSLADFNPLQLTKSRDFLASLLRWIFLFSSCQSQGTIWIETIK
ncbi:hypothetical protein AZJ30_10045, partial [Streptococcus pneumoniae]